MTFWTRVPAGTTSPRAPGIATAAGGEAVVDCAPDCAQRRGPAMATTVATASRRDEPSFMRRPVRLALLADPAPRRGRHRAQPGGGDHDRDDERGGEQGGPRRGAEESGGRVAERAGDRVAEQRAGGDLSTVERRAAEHREDVEPGADPYEQQRQDRRDRD